MEWKTNWKVKNRWWDFKKRQQLVPKACCKETERMKIGASKLAQRGPSDESSPSALTPLPPSSHETWPPEIPSSYSVGDPEKRSSLVFLKVIARKKRDSLITLALSMHWKTGSQGHCAFQLETSESIKSKERWAPGTVRVQSRPQRGGRIKEKQTLFSYSEMIFHYLKNYWMLSIKTFPVLPLDSEYWWPATQRLFPSCNGWYLPVFSGIKGYEADSLGVDDGLMCFGQSILAI